ncbi:MAG: GDSL-type esterase/lipase family protein [Bacteroidales bacterium]|nr:GDSL-type esterase/lipase family protein [Bacteroidales bacterium]
MTEYTKWVACWGNATSITDRKECTYAKDLTLRYPIRMCFSGSKLRFRFSNFTGTESVTLTKVSAARIGNGEWAPLRVLFKGKESVSIAAGTEVQSDDLEMEITAGETIVLSIYLGEYTQMNAGTLITGPLSKGKYSYGDFVDREDLPMNLSRNTNWFYFLNTIDILTEDKNRALICYGDSITAQSWPDYLSLRCWDEGYRNVSIIRRAVSGTRVLRQYDCITYQAYGLKGETRFPIEMNVAGAEAVIIQHGINDIIHPVGVENNPFRPWSDMPDCQSLIDGFKTIYLPQAKAMGLKVHSGTLLPIEGWRTYNPMREELRNEFNEWLRKAPEFDGCVDFDLALRDGRHPSAFAPGYDSGDHLHPSESAYKAMADCVPTVLLA